MDEQTHGSELYLIGCFFVSILLLISCVAILLCLYSMIAKLCGLPLPFEVVGFLLLTLINAIPGMIMIAYGIYQEERDLKEERKGKRAIGPKGKRVNGPKGKRAEVPTEKYEYLKSRLHMGYSINHLPDVFVPLTWILFALCPLGLYITYLLSVFDPLFILCAFFFCLNLMFSLVYLSWILGAIKKWRGEGQ